MRILVTGANGFVGRALCASLDLHGHLVRRAIRTLPDRPQTLSFAIGNIGPDTDWRTAVAGCDAVVHLAAHVHVLRGQGRIALKAKVDAVCGIAGVWRKRSAIQRLRCTSVARIWALLAGGPPWLRC